MIKALGSNVVVGAYVFVCNNGMVHGDYSYTLVVKHTGTANADIALSIAGQISVAKQNFTINLLQDKNAYDRG